MAVTLVGEIVNSCDATTGFNVGNISADDDNVEGTGAIGVKASSTTQAMYTTSLGAGAPYDYSSGGPEEGYHIVMWFNTKTPIAATGGLRIFAGDSVGADDGHWYVDPVGFYKGGFITKVIDTAADFDVVTGSWTTNGNPAQLTNVDELGGVFNTTTSIMGSFNNVQLDQITTGEGLRVDAGTVGTPNTFETVRAADEDTNFWGWWLSSKGAIIAQGKLYIGPSTGSATSVFNTTGDVVIWASNTVATGFYEINTRGAGTDVTLDGVTIRAEDPAAARWTLTVQSDTNSYDDTNGVYTGFDTLTLDADTTLDGTKLEDGNSIVQNGATITNCTVLDANTADGVALITSDTPNLISNCDFTFSDGHAIEIDTAGTYTFTGNTFTGYGTTGSNDAAIYNNSGGAVTLNIAGGGSTPTYRNGASATTTINNNTSVTLTGLVNPTEVRVYTAGTTTELHGSENVTTGTFNFSEAASSSVDIRIFATNYEPADILNYTVPASDASIPIQQRFDRNYNNP